MTENIIAHKICSKCKIEQPTAEFYKCAPAKDGLQSQCKDCQKLRKQSPEYKQQAREYTSKAYHADPQKAMEATRKWRAKNVDKQREYSQAYCKKNRERLTRQHREWVANNRQRMDELIAQHYEANKEAILAYGKEYRKNNPEKIKEIAQRRIERIKQNTIEEVDYDKILERDGFFCYLCEKDVLPEELSFDHVTPIAKGGLHCHDNIKVTHLRCNALKGTKTVERARRRINYATNF